MCSREGLLDLENEKHVVSYLGRAQLLLLFILEYLPTGDKLQLFHLGPIYLLPQLLVEAGMKAEPASWACSRGKGDLTFRRRPTLGF